MVSTAGQSEGRAQTHGLVPFGYGFRPFFLAAGWFAVITAGMWLWVYSASLLPLRGLPPQLWHGHEMLYGFIAAAVAGFMLTAVPSWTGSRGFAGTPLVIASAIWLTGRLAFGFGSALPVWALVLTELAFLPAIALLIGPALLRSKNRNLPLLLVLLALWTADAVFLYAADTAQPALASVSLRAGLNIVLLLITIIGGRIVPAFTANALRRRARTPGLVSRPMLERAVISLMLSLLVVDVLLPGHRLAALVALLAGIAQLWRLAGWRGWRMLSDPLVWILHAAYAWLPLGLLMKGVWLLGGPAWSAHWLHALGIGAAGAMILAVMTRAALGHTGRPLNATPLITTAYVLLLIAAAVRVFGPALLPLNYAATVTLAALLWIAAFLIYGIAYAPILLRPRVDGKPG